MAEDFAEFHDELRSVAGDLLAKDPQTEWSDLIDAGWVGLEVPDRLGGAGGSFGETAVVLDQIGRAAGVNRFLGGAVLPVGVLNALPVDDRIEALLAAVAAGQTRLAVVTDAFSCAEGRLTGHAEFVADAVDADQLLVLTDSAVVLAQATDLTVLPQPVVDETRRLAIVTADAAPVQVLGAADPAAAAVRQRAAVAIACDSLGLAEQMLTATVDYVSVRRQFGRPIGSFQAVKHACADMLVDIAVSRQLVGDAIIAVAERRDATIPAAMAKSHTCAVAVAVAGKAMQLHGGIGYTWESGIHRYLKRAALNRSWFGSTAAHRKTLSARYL
ncbi:acyl-CoA dehydrogenase family protein [Mycobacterium sp. SMC-4]|uniref:acyl-CoA dehydrogenase family protein n=1 Tax=Mycobacterium sp. SMC-4 TaxID=2857059 RepID=UPI0021B2DBB6|nr:acyl-CoA dehydrogenase family protein [Mycobacterium sp. SMC-4]UXA17277.1 acyl-CoA/acyl-ACP dehydrogenase [Mycobacterium sp. SMC-4]